MLAQQPVRMERTRDLITCIRTSLMQKHAEHPGRRHMEASVVGSWLTERKTRLAIVKSQPAVGKESRGPFLPTLLRLSELVPWKS